MAKIDLPKKFVSKYPHKFAAGKKHYLRGQRILPKPATFMPMVESPGDEV